MPRYVQKYITVSSTIHAMYMKVLLEKHWHTSTFNAASELESVDENNGAMDCLCCCTAVAVKAETDGDEESIIVIIAIAAAACDTVVNWTIVL